MWSNVKEWAEIYLSAILILLLITCVNPLEAMMPIFWDRTVIVLLIVVYGLYAGIVYREAARDERERLHVARAERIGFLTGATLVLVFIVFETFFTSVEKALVFVLGGMVLAKMIALIVLKIRN